MRPERVRLQQDVVGNQQHERRPCHLDAAVLGVTGTVILMMQISQAERRPRDPLLDDRAGALGLTQFMPATAKQYGVDRNNPLSEIDGTARYMSDLIRQNGGDLAKALEQYNNYGPGYAQEVMARMNGERVV